MFRDTILMCHAIYTGAAGPRRLLRQPGRCTCGALRGDLWRRELCAARGVLLGFAATVVVGDAPRRRPFVVVVVGGGSAAVLVVVVRRVSVAVADVVAVAAARRLDAAVRELSDARALASAAAEFRDADGALSGDPPPARGGRGEHARDGHAPRGNPRRLPSDLSSIDGKTPRAMAPWILRETGETDKERAVFKSGFCFS